MLTLITGGSRSGKSFYGLTLARQHRGRRAFIATATSIDDEMKARIENHQTERGDDFVTFEEPVNIAMVIDKLQKDAFNVAVIDCLTVWLGNLYHAFQSDDAAIRSHIEKLAESLKKSELDIIAITNEVGMGIVPDNELARRFRDMAGYVNRAIASIADEVYLCCCGIPIQIKGKDGKKHG